MTPVIIGGGISGLSTAYYLARRNQSATLIESRTRLGGVIHTEHIEGCTIEAGPDSFLSAKPAALELIGHLGMSDQVIGSNDHLRITFIKKNGRLVPLPDGLMMMVPTKILPLVTSPLLSLGTKARMGLELFRAPRLRGEDESVSDFIREHYGQEAVDYLAEPLLSGIYGGDPSRLSVRAVLPRFVELSEKYGSLTKGVLVSRAATPKPQGPAAPLFRTLRGGLGDLVDALTKAIAGHTTVRTARAEALERTAGGYRVRIGGDWLETSHVVLACEAHAAAALLAQLDPRAAELLASVGYSSSMTVALGYNAADFARPPRGFGFLIPKKERRRLVACTWVGTKFSHRIPAGKIVARCFVGGSGDAAILDEPDDVIINTVTSELREVAGVTARPIFTRIARWPRAMAQYAVGHNVRNKELESRIAELPGIYLAGNAYQGIGIPDCIRMGRAAAEKIG